MEHGITTYYKTMSALQGLDVDFGYELIDQDWLLDFPEDDGTVKQQPWMTARGPETSPGAAGPGRG